VARRPNKRLAELLQLDDAPDPGHQLRTIKPGIRGPNVESLGADVTLDPVVFPQNRALNVARWRQQNNETREVTVIGSSPTNVGGDVVLLNDLIELEVVLRYRAGGVTREDRWVWNPQGWRRTIMASDVEVIANRLSTNSNAGLTALTVGAGIADSAGVQDGTILTIRNGIPEGGQGGAARRTATFPHGTHEFRLWQHPSEGSFDLGFNQRTASPSSRTGAASAPRTQSATRNWARTRVRWRGSTVEGDRCLSL